MNCPICKQPLFESQVHNDIICRDDECKFNHREYFNTPIQKESRSYCNQYEEILNPKCPFLSRMPNYCHKFKVNLVGKEVTDMWSCRDEYVIERCKECKEMFK